MTNNKIILPLIILYFALFPFGQLDRIETSFFTIHITDIVVVFLGILGFYSFFKQKERTYLGFSFLAFGFIAILSYLINVINVGSQDMVRGMAYLLRLLSFIFFFFAIKGLPKENNLLLKNGLYYIGALTSLFALIQYILVPDTRVLSHFGWDPHFYRSIGTFLDPNFLGIILVLFILFLLQQRNNYILLLLPITALAFTFSRSSYLSLVVGLAALNLKNLQIKKTVLVLIVLLIMIVIAPKPGGEGVNLGRTSTAVARVSNYQMAIEKGFEKPLFGVGYNLLNWGDGQNDHSKYGVDSSLLFIFVATGVVGLLSFLSLLAQVLKKSWNNTTQISGIVFSSTVAIIIHSLFQNSFVYPWVLGWWIILLGMFEED